MDELDSKIIAMLQKDARVSNAGIARETGMSEGTVRRRVRRLVDEVFVNIVAMINPS